MVKVFDYSNSRKGWIEFPDYEAAKRYVENALDTYYLIDRDNCEDYFMEIYFDDKYEVWIGEFGSWLYTGDEESPYCNIYSGSREDFKYKKFTTLKPRVDYILI